MWALAILSGPLMCAGICIFVFDYTSGAVLVHTVSTVADTFKDDHCACKVIY